MTKHAKIERLTRKLHVLEGMLEDRSREAYQEAQQRAVMNSLLLLSLREPAIEMLLNSALEIIMAVDFLSIENKGCIFLVSAMEDDSHQPEEKLHLTAHQNLSPDNIINCQVINFGQCLCGRAALAEQAIICSNSDHRHNKHCLEMVSHSHYCMALRSRNKLEGVICLYLPPNYKLSVEQLDFLNNSAHILASAIQRHNYQQKIAAYQADLEKMVEAKIAQLSKAETRYTEMFNNSVCGIYQVSFAGRFLDCNPALANMLAYESPASLKDQVTDIATDVYADPSQRRDLLHRLHKGPVEDFVTKLKRRDGKFIWVQIFSRIVNDNIQGKSRQQSPQDGTGTTITGDGESGYIEGYILDITARREAEIALEAQKERLLVTLRSIGDGVIATDAQGRISMLNKVAENLTGWQQEDAMGLPLTDVFHIINEKTRSTCDNPVDKVLQSGAIVGLANHTALIAKDGTERIIADSGAPIRDRHSEIIGVVLVFRDITSSHKLKEELRRKRQLESLGVLAGGIAHDFNNILTAIMGNINLAEYIIKNNNKATGLLKQANKASRRAAALVQQLLTFSKGGDPVRSAASLVEVIEGTTDFIMRGSNIGCEYKFGENISLAHIDSGQISQVIQNLVINAKQAMPGGGNITIECYNFTKTSADSMPLRNGDYLRVSVRDEGSGIPESRLENIFDPYFTTKKTGSGLGLAIVHSIINKHDGYITVESRLGVGTVFSFYLPATDKQAVMSGSAGNEISTRGNGTILLMDDDEMVRDATSQMLDILGYQSVKVGTGQEAVARYQAAMASNTPFRAVIMDLTIAGGMGGKEAVRQVLQHDPEAKVLVVSGYGNEPVLANPKAYGFSASLVKPFAMDDLARQLNDMLADS